MKGRDYEMKMEKIKYGVLDKCLKMPEDAKRCSKMHAKCMQVPSRDSNPRSPVPLFPYPGKLSHERKSWICSI